MVANILGLHARQSQHIHKARSLSPTTLLLVYSTDSMDTTTGLSSSPETLSFQPKAARPLHAPSIMGQLTPSRATPTITK
eukprot:3237050-Amphidinium_carterae.1